MIIHRLAFLMLFAAAVLGAQDTPPPPPPPAAQPVRPAASPRPVRTQGQQLGPVAPQPPQPPQPPIPRRPPLERAMGGPSGRWWTRPEMAQELGLTADQKKRMDDIFQQSRLKLIDLNAVVQKEEAIMEPLVSADQPDESKIVGQIDKVAQARAELEKANARMLLGIRRVLTPEQWEKLKSEPRAPRAAQLPGAPQPARLPRR